MSVVYPNPAASVGRESWPTLLEHATREVFAVMVGSELAPAGEPVTGEGMNVTSMVGLAGQICGVLTIRCASEAAARMAAKMLGVDAPTGEDISDAIGEICNMIAGDFKHKIAGMSEGCMLSVPTVITGADYNLHSLAASDKIETQQLFEGRLVIVSLEVHG